MRYASLLVRPVLFAAAAVLLCTACLPPIAFHDGLPAWSPEPGKVEFRAGYNRLWAFYGDSEWYGEGPPGGYWGSFGYLNPGVRWGLSRSPAAADVGLTSMMNFDEGGYGLMVGPAVGFGRCHENLSIMFRTSVYLLGLFPEEDPAVDFSFWPQAVLLVGNGYRARGVNLSVGGRASMLAIGPVGFADVNLGTVALRGEVSYMLPFSWISTGTALSAGLMFAAPGSTGPLLIEPEFE